MSIGLPVLIRISERLNVMNTRINVSGFGEILSFAISVYSVVFHSMSEYGFFSRTGSQYTIKSFVSFVFSPSFLSDFSRYISTSLLDIQFDFEVSRVKPQCFSASQKRYEYFLLVTISVRLPRGVAVTFHSQF